MKKIILIIYVLLSLLINPVFADNIIKDIKFDGEACAICTSSSSIMTETLIGKTKEEALKIINNLYKRAFVLWKFLKKLKLVSS